MRVGIFTGRQYEDDIDSNSIGECVIQFVGGVPTEERINNQLKQLSWYCLACMGCENAKKGGNDANRLYTEAMEATKL